MNNPVGKRNMPTLIVSVAAARPGANAAAAAAPRPATNPGLRKFHPYLIIVLDRIAELLEQLFERPVRDAHADHRIEELPGHATRNVVRSRRA